MINLEREIRQQPEVLGSVEISNITAIRAAVAAAKAAGVNQIAFAARGTSDHACIYAQYLFGIRCGIPCSLCTPSVVSQYGAHINYKNTLVIGVSQSGMAKDVLSVIEDAKSSGAVTVAVTNNSASPLASAADYHLFCDAGDELSIAATKTFTAQAYLLALLAAEWVNDGELFSALRRVPSAVGELLDYMPGEIDGFISNYKELSDVVVLGRGMLYPIALEGALKMLETNRIRVKGYPISDFHHGPMAQLSKGSTVVLLAGEGPVLGDAREMLDKLRGVGADIILITDSDSMANEDGVSHLLRVPSLGGDMVSPFVFAVTMQLIALKLTQVKGIDPDKSAVLHKITITK